MALAYILFGVIDDAPGVIWVPGKGPVPVDPGWGTRIAAPKRDLIASLAMHEITQTITDPATRSKLNKSAVEAMQGAVQRIAGMR
jgi:hypothetical protein